MNFNNKICVAILIIIFPLLLLAQSNSVQNLKETLKQIQEKRSILFQEQSSQREQQMFRTAQSYIRMNRFDDAIKLLKYLVEHHPNNRTYYEWLLRSYLMISNVEEAEKLVNRMRKQNPNSFYYEIDRGTILYKKEQKEEALKIWDQILRQHDQNLNAYTEVANAMLQNRLPDKAISVYERALENISNSSHLYQNIASVYQSRLMYSEAAKYYIKYLENRPNQQRYIFNRILSFEIDSTHRPEFFKTLNNLAKDSENPKDIQLLTAQLYQRYQNFKEALKIYESMEDEKSNGRYLLQFAHAAEQDSSFQLALKAYRMVIEEHPQSDRIMEAYSGAVTTLFSLAEQTENAEYAQEALQLIHRVREKIPKHPQLAQLIYLEGIFQLNYFFDVDAAISSFLELLQRDKVGSSFRAKALLKIGECHLIKGDLKKAPTFFKKVNHAQHKGIALLQTARTYYFSNQPDTAKSILNSLIKKEGIKSEVTNDALALQMRITQAQSEPEILKKLSEADFQIFQRKKSEAIKTFSELLERNSIPPIIKSEVYFETAQLSIDLEKYTQSLEFCTKAVKDSSVRDYVDQHLFLMASLLEDQLSRPEEAFETYRQILEKYPHSLFAQQARDRMKILRNQKSLELP